jgi:hypothetical protein
MEWLLVLVSSLYLSLVFFLSLPKVKAGHSPSGPIWIISITKTNFFKKTAVSTIVKYNYGAYIDIKLEERH